MKKLIILIFILKLNECLSQDISWINGQNRQKDFPLTLKDKDSNTMLTGVAYFDGYFNYNFARPKDNTQTVSSTTGRTNEFTVNLASIGIETNYRNIIGRLWLQYQVPLRRMILPMPLLQIQNKN